MKSMKLRIVYGDVVFGVHGNDFHYLFSYQAGGLESLAMDGKEWLYRVPKPAFWRALTDNDKGSGFHLRSGMWLAADMFSHCIGCEVMVDGAQVANLKAPENNCFGKEETADTVSVCFTYQTLTAPVTEAKICYQVWACGSIAVTASYHGKKGLPGLPVFGVRFLIPTAAEGFRYEGLSGETYPDRMAGGIAGVYEVKGLPVTPYLAPQDCGMHMDTEWVEIYRNATKNNADRQPERFGVRVRARGEKFAFSCLPYTPEELENATHHEELPPVRRTVLTVCGAVRGVGGINSWGADVEEAYRIDAEKDREFSFFIERI